MSSGDGRGGGASDPSPGITPASDPTAVEDKGLEIGEGKPAVPDCVRPVADHIGVGCIGRISSTARRGVDEGESQVEIAAVREIPRTRNSLPLPKESRRGHPHAPSTEGESGGAAGPQHKRGRTGATGPPQRVKVTAPEAEVLEASADDGGRALSAISDTSAEGASVAADRKTQARERGSNLESQLPVRGNDRILGGAELHAEVADAVSEQGCGSDDGGASSRTPTGPFNRSVIDVEGEMGRRIAADNFVGDAQQEGPQLRRGMDSSGDDPPRCEAGR